MNRKELREMCRFYMQELLERPEGMIKDDEAAETDLNNLMNIAQHSVEIDLIPHIPDWFRKKFLFSITVDKGDYHIEDDLSVTDFMRMEDIYHNESGQKPQGLLYVKPDQLQQHDIAVGEKGDPKVWLWEAKLTVGLRPVPSATIAERYKAYYFFKIPNLKYDDADIDEEKIGTGDGTTLVFTHTALKIPVKKSSVKITYTISTTEYEATDDGAGVITGTSCSGTIDYETGEISLTFTSAPDDTEDILLDATATNKHIISALPEVVHELIPIDAVKRCNLASEDDVRNVDTFYKEQRNKAINNLFLIEPSLSSRARPPLEEVVR